MTKHNLALVRKRSSMALCRALVPTCCLMYTAIGLHYSNPTFRVAAMSATSADKNSTVCQHSIYSSGLCKRGTTTTWQTKWKKVYFVMIFVQPMQLYAT